MKDLLIKYVLSFKLDPYPDFYLPPETSRDRLIPPDSKDSVDPDSGFAHLLAAFDPVKLCSFNRPVMDLMMLFQASTDLQFIRYMPAF